MLDRFIQVIDSRDQYNKQPGRKPVVEAIPIIIYHRIGNSGAPYSTKLSLFAEEMRYLYDNDFKVVSLGDLVYDNNTNSFYLKNSSFLVVLL